MIQVFKLTKRHMDDNKNLSRELKEIKVFSTCVGHGVGTIDFSEKVLEISEDELSKIIENSGEYVKFKIGNISKYFEVEIFAEHAAKLIPQMCECEFKEILRGLKEGYLMLRKIF
ncbi:MULTISPECIES: formate hydrogenlyase maturation HycH family protein [unclassified Campylobacter]|uniref:formate hydrogenlyase maturation HycH family protein n=1 Tax=unclassified Campylobacter TaxID=2593542 RepID=UPI003D348DD2